MINHWRIASNIKTEPTPWGAMRWVSHPPSTGTKQLTTAEAIIVPGHGHSFHKHPQQEEVIFVVSGKVEQWLDSEKRILAAGDAVFVPAGMAHASFNAGNEDARLVAIFGPSVGESGFE